MPQSQQHEGPRYGRLCGVCATVGRAGVSGCARVRLRRGRCAVCPPIEVGRASLARGIRKKRAVCPLG
eukprot:11212320-Lingulodinium_polyedra.AAC.1